MPTANGHGDTEAASFKPCSIKVLDPEKRVAAAEDAIRQNPGNAPNVHMAQQGDPKHSLTKDRLAALTGKYWGNTGVHLTVSFLDSPPAELRKLIVSHMNAWAQYANVKFVETASRGEVRIARTAGEGYWSYLGTDIRSVPPEEPTMNLDTFTMNTEESEFYRVVRHETGHTLGFVHEHLRKEIVLNIDRDEAFAFFKAEYHWSKQMVIDQVLTALNDAHLLETRSPDQNSIMCYWLPASIMKNHIEVRGGKDIDVTDGDFASLVYPKKLRDLS